MPRAGEVAALLAVAGAAFLWATLGIAGKALYAAGAQPMTVVAWRALLAALALLIALALRAPGLLRVPRSELRFFALFGLVVAANYACYFLALRHVPVAVAIILLYTYPALVVVAAHLLFGETFGPGRWLALGLTFAGIVLVVAGGRPEALRLSGSGIVLGLGAAVTMAAYSLLGKRAGRAFSPWTTALYSFSFAALWLAAAQGQRLAQALAYTPAMWVGLLYLALGPTLMGYGLFLWAIQRIEVGRASVWTTLEPPVAALLAFAILGEQVDAVQMAGGALILLGVALVQRRRSGT